MKRILCAMLAFVFFTFPVVADEIFLPIGPSGLITGKPGNLNSFAVAGKDKKWHWAVGRIEGDKVIVSSSKVSKPMALRYAWAMNPSRRNLLYNKEGIPASPFRTDDWPLFDPKVEYEEGDKPRAPEGYESKDWKRPGMTQ